MAEEVAIPQWPSEKSVRSQQDEDVEEEACKSEQFLKRMQTLSTEEQDVKMMLMAEFKKTKKAKWHPETWLYLRKGLHVQSGGSPLWQSTKECRHKILETIENKNAEVAVLFLVLTDMVMVILEAVLDSLGIHDGGHGTEHGGDHRLLASAGGGGSCDVEKAQEIASTCRTISIIILFFFVAELLIKFVCAPKGFITHVGHIIDVVVTVSSVIFEFALHHSAGGLLIFFRSWRGVRIAHGLYEEVLFIHKALETEEHLEKALRAVSKYKAYTTLRNLRDDWFVFKKKGEEGIKDLKTKVIIAPEDVVEDAVHTTV